MKNAGPQHGTAEMKIQKSHFIGLKMMVCFNLEIFEMIFRRYLDHFMKFIKINVLFGQIVG